MKLVQPTDFEILDALSDGQRNNAVNIAETLGRDRSYINTRLPQLAEYNLIESVGPANNSGLYQITQKGKRAIQYRHKYKEKADTFESMLTE